MIYNNVHALETYIQMYVNVCFDTGLERLVLVKYHVVDLVTYKQSCLRMLNEWFKNFAKIRFRIHLDTMSQFCPCEITREQTKKPGTHESLLTYLRMCFTDAADSAMTTTATQIKHCLICRHKDFLSVTI